jgi:hypothetical protein
MVDKGEVTNTGLRLDSFEENRIDASRASDGRSLAGLFGDERTSQVRQGLGLRNILSSG